MRIAHHRHKFLHVNKAKRVVEMPAHERETRMLGSERFLYVFLEALLDVERYHFAARRHDIAHHAATQIEHVHEQIAPER